MKKSGQSPQPLTPTQRQAVTEYLTSNLSLKETAFKYGVHYTTLLKWKRKYFAEKGVNHAESPNP